MTERDPLNLADLPDSQPPRDYWPDIAGRLATVTARRRGPLPWSIAAAGLLAVLVAVSILLQAPSPATPDLASLKQRSAYLESITEVARPGVLSDSHAARAAELEVWLADVDQVLQAHPESPVLWRERNRALAALIDTYGQARMERDPRYTAL